MSLPEEVFPMTGGSGATSYVKNSYFQGNVGHVMRAILKEAIAEKLEIEEPKSTTFTLADLGCSIGQNTLFAVQTITDAICEKYTAHGFDSCSPEFHVFFNDLPSSDFNILFTSLPADRNYFASGVPGSFYSRLFPRASIDFVYSSLALQWLSEVPQEVRDERSSAWNKGRITYVGAPCEVGEAYREQFERDMSLFLNARAEEMVVGGLMALIMPMGEEGRKPCDTPCGLTLHCLGSALMDMVEEGLIEEEKVNSFNLPLYFSNATELNNLLKRNGSFIIEKLEVVRTPSDHPPLVIKPKTMSLTIRAAMEKLIGSYFGGQIIEGLFERNERKVEEKLHLFKSGAFPVFFVLLRRKG